MTQTMFDQTMYVYECPRCAMGLFLDNDSDSLSKFSSSWTSPCPSYTKPEWPTVPFRTLGGRYRRVWARQRAIH